MRKTTLGPSSFRGPLVIATAAIVCVGCGKHDAPHPPAKTTKPKPILETLATNCTVDQFHINGLRSDKDVGQIVFAHPNSQCALPVTDQSHYLSFSFGILEGAILTSPKTGGVEFRVSTEVPGSESKLLWSRALDPVKNISDRGPQNEILRIDGSGNPSLIFETMPISGSQNNWSYWSKIVLSPELDYLGILNDGKLLDQFHIDGLRSEPPLGKILFAHPHSQFALPVVKGMRSIQFHFGFLDNALKGTTKPEGVEFRLVLQTKAGQKTLWSQALKPATVESDRGPHEGIAVLDKGVEGRLIFETLPLGKPENDWSYWSNISVEWPPT